MTKTKTKIYKLYYYGTDEELYLTFKPTNKEILEIAQKKNWFDISGITDKKELKEETRILLTDCSVTKHGLYDR
jgi:hypothetical protein